MPIEHFKPSEAFIQMLHLLLDLQISVNAGDESAADAVRDKIDLLNSFLNKREEDAWLLVSGDLDDAWEVLRGQRTQREHTNVRLPRFDAHAAVLKHRLEHP